MSSSTSFYSFIFISLYIFLTPFFRYLTEFMGFIFLFPSSLWRVELFFSLSVQVGGRKGDGRGPLDRTRGSWTVCRILRRPGRRDRRRTYPFANANERERERPKTFFQLISSARKFISFYVMIARSPPWRLWLGAVPSIQSLFFFFCLMNHPIMTR